MQSIPLKVTKRSHLCSFKGQRTHRPRRTFQNQLGTLLNLRHLCQHCESSHLRSYRAGYRLVICDLTQTGGWPMAGERVLDGLRMYRKRYKKADKAGRSRLLDEFCKQTGYHRKYAIAVLRKPADTLAPSSTPRRRGPTYTKPVVPVRRRRSACWRRFGRRRATHGRNGSRPCCRNGCRGRTRIYAV